MRNGYAQYANYCVREKLNFYFFEFFSSRLGIVSSRQEGSRLTTYINRRNFRKPRGNGLLMFLRCLKARSRRNILAKEFFLVTFKNEVFSPLIFFVLCGKVRTLFQTFEPKKAAHLMIYNGLNCPTF